jgi:hypothetical protein
MQKHHPIFSAMYLSIISGSYANLQMLAVVEENAGHVSF